MRAQAWTLCFFAAAAMLGSCNEVLGIRPPIRDTCGVCNQPPTECFDVPGTCGGASCTYSPSMPGTPCSGGGSCDGNGNCVPQGTGGGCGSCTTPPTDCYLLPGFCNGPECKYMVLNSGISCAGGLCDGMGMCVTPTCPGPCNTAPAECYDVLGAYCLGTMCQYPASNGFTTCNLDQSYCDGAGACTKPCMVNDDCMGVGNAPCCCHPFGDPPSPGGCFSGGSTQCSSSTNGQGICQ
jgi:hypothetical protein